MKSAPLSAFSVQKDRLPRRTKRTQSARSLWGEGRNAMSPVVRWVKFNLVGAAGMVLQLGVLALLNRLMAGRYLLATAVAIEITLLHNFAWHVLYTWRDRGSDGRIWIRLGRFLVSNGVISMAGNLALMPLLVGVARMPVVAANALAVLACSVVNFWLGDGWVFAGAAVEAGILTKVLRRE